MSDFYITSEEGVKAFVRTATPASYVVQQARSSEFRVDGALRGPKGDTGATGAQGPQGIQGIQGPQGATGPQGPKGDTGLTGSQGPAGATGPEGPQGPDGPTGATGAQGPQGEQGIQGPAGPQGIQGPQGLQGEQGETGPQGPQGIQGIQGPTGADGADGISVIATTGVLDFGDEEYYTETVVNHASLTGTSNISLSYVTGSDKEEIAVLGLVCGVQSVTTGSVTIFGGAPNGASGTYTVNIHIV